MIPFAVDPIGGAAAAGTLFATVVGAIIAWLTANRQGEALETRSLIEVNEDLRREIKRRGSEIKELRGELAGAHDEVDEYRAQVNTLQLRVGDLRAQIEELDKDLKRALASHP